MRREDWKVVQLRVTEGASHGEQDFLILKSRRFRFWNGTDSTMTRHAVLWCGLVEKNCLGLNYLRQLMALSAAHLLMRAPQGKCSSLFMVELRRLPFGAVVTLGASSDVPVSELAPVDVLMTVLALAGSGSEIDVQQLRFHIRRFVAIDACGGTMCSEQSEFCCRVVES